jgi:ATP-binding cassette subfamily B protein
MASSGRARDPMPPLPTPNAPPPPPALSWTRARLVFTNLAHTMRLALGLDRGLTLRYFSAQVVDAVLPVALAYVGKRIVDAVVDAHAGRGTASAALGWVVVELGLFVAKHAAAQTAGFLAALLRSRLATHVDVLIFKKALGLSIRHFEDPTFMNMLDRARKESSWRPVEIITHGFSLARDAITLFGFGVLLFPFSPWAVLALAVASLPFLAEMRYAAEQYAMKAARTIDERQSGYLQSLLTSDWYAREVKLFSLGPMLVDRYRAYESRFTEEDHRFARRRGLGVSVLGAASALTFYGIYAWVVARTVSGSITLGEMTLCLTAFRQGQGAFQSAMVTISRTYEDNLYIQNLFEFLALPDDDLAKPSFDAPRGTAPAVDVENVTFRYPGAEKDAITDVSFRVAPGETVALVGPNGAGKTTLVKLLTGLCAATAGRILLDGEDVSTLERGSLRSRIGVVLQDFVHYHFTAGENVGLGWLPDVGDDERVAEAARAGGASEVIEALPAKYRTMLGRWFGGEQLSGGQWQRVALARAFMRRSELLVLDEPTASLDAEGEHAVFERFRALKANRTAILITHRFGNVRMADRIVVLDAGRIVEEGTHADLLAKGGLYARMFRLQAAGYTGAGPGDGKSGEEAA